MAALKMLEVDAYGFDEIDRKLMLTILEKYNGAPVGVGSHTAALSEKEGRNYCIPDDIKQLAPFVLSHRLAVVADYSSQRKRSEEAGAILAEILRSIDIPM